MEVRLLQEENAPVPDSGDTIRDDDGSKADTGRERLGSDFSGFLRNVVFLIRLRHGIPNQAFIRFAEKHATDDLQGWMIRSNMNRNQMLAVIERIVSDHGDAIRYGDEGKATAGRERPAPNSSYFHAVKFGRNS